jgi:hypothetical protein
LRDIARHFVGNRPDRQAAGNFLAGTPNGNYGTHHRKRPSLLRLDIGSADHLTPFFGFGGEVFSEFGWRKGERHRTQLDKSRFELVISETRINLGIELINNLGRCARWCADAILCSCLVAGYEIGDHGDVGERLPFRVSIYLFVRAAVFSQMPNQNI